MKKYGYVLILCSLLAFLCPACGGQTEVPGAGTESGETAAGTGAAEKQEEVQPAGDEITEAEAAGQTETEQADTVAIVIGDEENRGLADQLQAAMGGDAFVTDQYDADAPGEKILLGNTSAERSASCAEGVRERDCVIRFFPEEIVILGGSPEKLSKAVEYFEKNYVSSWKAGGGFPQDASADYYGYGNYKLQALAFDGAAIYRYSIVTENGQETEAALLLQQNLEKLSGYHLPVIGPDELAAGQKAIVFGSSGARDSESLCSGLAEKEFLIQADGDSLYLCAWDVSDELSLAYMFLGETLGANLYQGTAAHARVNLEQYALHYTTRYDPSEEFVSMNTQVARIEIINRWYNVMQGGCTDGTYAYYLMQDQIMTKDTYCVIVKMDLADWEIVDISEPLEVEHGNSITYVPEKGQLLVAHCKPNASLASWIDPESLEVTETIDLQYRFSTLSWNPAKQLYAAYGAGKEMLIIDKDFQIIARYGGLSDEYESQGYSVDEDYIYILSINENLIHICDWEGNKITTVPIGVPTELENMFTFGSLHFTGYYNTGGDVYATVLYRLLDE